ncbi:MAG: hypothetical protein LBG94_10255 [Treponema sp.]|jgi:hypothetical protein|nr:hypothetical protein [Treponema sp.]
MRNDSMTEKTTIEPGQLIGTKWTSWKKMFGDRVSVEFVDHANCIYTARPKEFNLTYTIRDGLMYISNIQGSFILKESVLYNNGLPVFEKAA